MKAQTIKGLLAAGAMLASVAAWGETVESTATLNANLDTRGTETLVVSEPEGVFALAWNNTADWRKNGDGSGAAATVTATPMLALPGPAEGWIPSGEPTTLVNAQTGEGVAPFEAQDGTGYRFVFTVGESSVTSYVAVAAQGLGDRATVAIDGSAAPVADAPLTAAATALEGKTVGDCTYAWYRYDFEQKWYEGEVVSTDAAYMPTAADYEMFLRVLVTDADGYVAFGPAIWFSKLPVIYIETEGHQPAPANKADIGAKMTMQGNAKFTNTKQLYSGALKLHIRGNTTSNADKKPYKIKLDSKADLLGLGKNKHWALLSNPYDISLMRNKVIYDLSEQLGLTAMASEWADVILNGAFVGNYQVCEHIRVGSTRVDIFDWEDKADKVAEKVANAKRDATKPAPTEDVPDPEPTMTEEEYEALLSDLETYLEQNLQWITTGSFVYKNETYVLSDYGEDIATYDTTGGYLFELDPYADEVSMFNSGTADGTLNMLIKANRPEYLKTNPEMYGYAQTMWSNYWAAIISPDGYHNGQHFSEFCDIDSMTGYWLAQVIPAQGDYQWSRYAYIPQQKGITWGPAWDFDNACGGRSTNWIVTEGSGVTGGRANPSTGWSLGTKNGAAMFYCHWNNDPRFVQLLVEKFQQVTPYLDNLLKDGGAFDEMYDYLLESGVANARRWAGRMGGNYAVTAGTRFDDYPGVAGPNGYGDAHWFKYVLKNRVEWIKSQFTSVRAGVTSLGAAKTGANPYTDTVGDFTLDIDGQSLDMSNSKEGATPDKIVPAGDLVATVGVATEGARRFAVYVNGLLNGTYTIAKGSANIEVKADELKVGERNMLSFAALDADGNRLTTSYALLTVVEPAKFPQSVADLEDATIEVETMCYTGAPLTPAVTLKTADGTTLVAGVDYTVSYSNNVHYGLATVTVTGTGNPTGEGEFGENGNWIGSRTFTFEIVENVVSAQTKMADLDTREPQVYVVSNTSEILDFAYNNKAAWPRGGDPSAAAASVVVMTMMSGDPTADPTTWTETSGLDTLDAPLAEGTTTWCPQAKALYRSELTDADGVKTRAYYNLLDCEGLGKSIRHATVTLSAEDMTYTGEQLKPEITVELEGVTLVENQDYTVTVTDNVNVGLATITIRGTGAYVGVTTKTFCIQPQPATRAVALDTREPQVYVVSNASEILDFAYNNKAVWPRGGDPSAAAAGVVVSLMSGEPAADPTTWTETSGLDTLDAPLAEGTTTWYPEAKALYRAELTDADGVKTKAYFNLLDCEGLGKSIRGATVTLSAEDLTYTGEQLKPEISVELEDVTLVEGQDYTVTVTDNVNAGLATITIQGLGT